MSNFVNTCPLKRLLTIVVSHIYITFTNIVSAKHLVTTLNRRYIYCCVNADDALKCLVVVGMPISGRVLILQLRLAQIKAIKERH